ncbi:MAG: putative Serine-type D-Ala-D-Ala carboxypeptidase [Actinomycetia bacterium]|nr:putative Serine-type D-Ala-D-Ala carboxypeptidase [Actinomycetes bacterium]
MAGLVDSVGALAADTRFSGVVRADAGDDVVVAGAYGYANRAFGVPNTCDSQFAIASGVKGLTALTIVSLIEQGQLDLTTTARSVLEADLPLIDDDVTVEHLLEHRSGIGDYLDEDAHGEIDEYVLAVPVYELRNTEQYLRVLDGHVRKFEPDTEFSYSNGGYVVLALMAERISGTPFHDLVEQRVCVPAGMVDTGFLQSDELPGRAAVGYLEAEGLRTNVLHLPVRGSGDGGIYSTAADVRALWVAMFSGRIVAEHWVARMISPCSVVPAQGMRYGLGFWTHGAHDAVTLEGFDAGVSFRTVHDPLRNITHTVLSNTSNGAWPITRHLDEQLGM